MAEARPTVAIAGATGFVGSALREALAGRYRLVGLTRSPARAALKDPADPVEWRHCDLFSLLELEQGLDGVDYAVYLVHSMLPSSRLDQSRFQDLDLILADNFARAARRTGVKHIVYLSGLLPEDKSDLSLHLQSRYEVEQALAGHGTPVTTLRTGLVVGAGGSSLRILVNLVKRLPAMALPSWTESDTQPIALRDVIRAIEHVLGQPDRFDGPFDVAGPDVMSYREMMERTSAVLEVRRPMFKVPFVTPKLSTLWVSLVSGSPQALAGPLVASLQHDMVVRPNPVQAAIGPDALGFEAALKRALTPEGDLRPDPRKPLRRVDDRHIKKARLVRSVQRYALPEGRTAEWVGHEYLRWLDGFVGALIRVDVDESADSIVARFTAGPVRTPVLELTFVPDRSQPDRALFYVTGGLLFDRGSPYRGRLEFRSLLERRVLLAAIHDFAPRLPWIVYRYTQALAHLFVMRRFGRYLERVPPAPHADAEPKPELPEASTHPG